MASLDCYVNGSWQLWSLWWPGVTLRPPLRYVSGDRWTVNRLHPTHTYFYSVLCCCL